MRKLLCVPLPVLAIERFRPSIEIYFLAKCFKAQT